ncbi:MAG TPA: CopG family transcriptional regulator [Dehalococcoidia bacterium]|jgi:hypothetical protein
MKRKQIHIEPELEYQVKEAASARGISESLFIREAIAAHLKYDASSTELSNENPLLGIIGIGTSDITDASVNHDHYLYGAPKKRR